MSIAVTPSPPRSHLPALTGLRFFAALWVVCCHFAPVSRDPAHQGFISRLALAGHVGVPLFFILSGFILTYTYAASAGMRGTRRAFYVARFARIYPVYALSVAFALAPYVWWHDPQTNPIVAVPVTLGLVQAWSPTYALALDPPAWSLSCELLFYALFPLLLPAVLRMSVGHLWRVALLAIALSLVAGTASADVISGSAAWALTLCNPVLRLPQFALGIVVCRLWLLGIPAPRLHPIWTVAALIAIVACGPAVPSMLLSHGPLDPLFALLIWQLAARPSALGRTLSRPALVLLGESSYALYLLHYPLWDWLARLSGYTESTLRTSTPIFPAYLLAGVVLSVVVYRVVEVPAGRAIRAVGGRETRVDPHAHRACAAAN